MSIHFLCNFMNIFVLFYEHVCAGKFLQVELVVWRI